MKPGIVYVWSSGLEEWEETNPVPYSNYVDVGTYQHTKTFGQGRIFIFKDYANRYTATYSETK